MGHPNGRDSARSNRAANKIQDARVIVSETSLSAVKTVLPKRICDERGFFCEVWNRAALADAGIVTSFVQENHSHSRFAGTVRGLHFQRPPMAQAKLMSRGAIMDVVVDIRRGSKTYGHHCKVELSAESGLQLYVPEGFLHGFVTLTGETDVYYLVNAHWSRECEEIVRWNDADLGIDWGINVPDALLSDKDASAPAFTALDSPFEYVGEK